MPQVRSPRKGSKAYWPRKKASRIYPNITSYPESDKPKFLAFAGYKAGMTHVIIKDNKKGSPSLGQDISVTVTILDCPPLKIVGVRAYEKTIRGLKVFSEAWIKDLPKYTDRKVKIKAKTDEKLKKIQDNLQKTSNLRFIVITQPKISGIGKKTPEIFEIEIGGKDINEIFEFAKQFLSKDVNVTEAVKEGELVDVLAVTKGKGTAGPVKRFGVKIQNRHAKQKRRHVGAIGGERNPSKIRTTVAMPGQLGFQTRTELNKRILKIGDGKEINPKSGFKRYGLVKGDFVMLQGSVPGPKKRLILLRSAIRPQKVKLLAPEIKEIVK